MSNMKHHDMKILFETWWNALNDKTFIQNKDDVARAAFFVAYEIGLNRGHAMGQELGTAIARLEAKIEKDKS